MAIASRKHISDFDKGRIIALRAQGGSYRSIALKFKRSQSTIFEIVAKYENIGSTDRKEGSGRPPKLSPRDIEHIVLCVKRNRKISAKQIRKDLGLFHVTEQTITRAIRFHSPFRSHWCTKKPFISIKNIRHRIQWCRQHLDWSKKDWSAVVWTDESPFFIRNGTRFRVWRGPGERLDKRCMKGTVKHDKKINVWGCFAACGVGHLHRIHGIMNKEVYLDILENVALPSCEALFPADADGHHDYMFQQDKDPKHTAKRVMRYLKKKFNLIHGDPLDWPAQSPDLNPIENLWAQLDFATKDRVCNTEEQLFNVLSEAWHNLPLEYLEGLIESMPRRIEAVLKARGMSTKY